MTGLLALLAGLCASACAGALAYADGALLSIDPLVHDPDARLSALVTRRERAHRALAFSRLTMQLLAGAACAAAVRDAPAWSAIPFAFIALAGVALVVLSETTARELGDRAGRVGVARTVGFVELVERALTPVVLLGEWIDSAVQSAVPGTLASTGERDATVEQFRHVVTSEADAGERGSALLTGVFSLGDTTVGDVMTPRVDIVGIERDAPWAEMLARVRSSEHSRVVVHDGSLDGVVGILYAKDLLPFIAADEEPADGWVSCVRPPMFIPSGKPVDTQLREFRATGLHIAIVADEYGGTAGIVTIEDILELIVGEIRDERDREEPEIEGERGRYWVSGRVTLDQLSEVVGDDLRHDEVTTVGGLAYELFGRVPRPGEMHEFRGWRLVVELVRGRRVDRVFVERGDVPATPPGDS